MNNPNKSIALASQKCDGDIQVSDVARDGIPHCIGLAG